MKETVIALRGKGNVGKSETIKKVYDLLKSRHTGIIEEHKMLTKKDVRVVITRNGRKIGIESQGDPNGRLRKSLALFVKVGCVVIICATRTYGDTVDAVNDLQPTYTVLWLNQAERSSPSEQEASNEAKANEIVRAAAKIIGV